MTLGALDVVHIANIKGTTPDAMPAFFTFESLRVEKPFKK
jgi:hypothetical protein